MASITSTFLYSKLLQILLVSTGILLKVSERQGYPSKVYHNDLQFFCAKPKESFAINWLNVIEESLCTKNFASL